METAVLRCVLMLLSLYRSSQATEYTLGMDSETSCTKTHYYEAGDVFTVSASGMVHDGLCPLTFVQSGSWHGDSSADSCVSLCIKILSYTMESCQIKMAYHDGLSDFTPVTFDCHTFPPVMWCSSNNDVKVSVAERKNYQGKNYAITLEVTPFCGDLSPVTSDPDVDAQPNPDRGPKSRTVIIIGAVVGTISILFVIGWLMYCYNKRQNSEASSTSQPRPDRSRTPPATVPPQKTRYTAVERNPPSSQSSSDRGAAAAFRDKERPPNPPVPNLGTDRRLYSPFQVPTRGAPYGVPGQEGPPFYSEIDRDKMGLDPRYPMKNPGPGMQESFVPVGFSTPSKPLQPGAGVAPSYPTANPAYKYPAYESREMHTAPTDTKYVVYDFDYPAPMERKYSTGKGRHTPVADLAGRDFARDYEVRKPREITPLRETVRIIDTTTTDHTSDYDTSMSETTEDDTTDDQMPPSQPYVVARPYQYRPGFTRAPDSRFYDPRNFQPVNPVPRPAQQSEPMTDRTAVCDDDSGVAASNQRARNLVGGGGDTGGGNTQKRTQTRTPESVRPSQAPGSSGEMPVPQVPPLPSERAPPQVPPLPAATRWPQGPPPPYSASESHAV